MFAKYAVAPLVSIFFLTGCLVLNPGPRPTIAPRQIDPSTLDLSRPDNQPGISSQNASSESIVFDNSIQPAIDPDIAALVSAVSQQQLVAYIQKLGEFGTRNSFSDTASETFGIGATRRWIASEFERVGGGNLLVEMQDFSLTYDGLTAGQQNVIATLPGLSGYAGIVVINAHYDSRVGGDTKSATDGVSRSPSANDNGSGVAMLLELARLLSSRRWNQTIVFAAFSSEEQGTAGSRWYVNQAILSNSQIDWAVSNDAIGGHVNIPQESVRMFAPNLTFSKSGATARYISYLINLYQPGLALEVVNALDRPGRYGDHREFVNANIGAVRVIELVEDENRLNSVTDTWEKIDYSYLASVTRINLIAVANWIGAPPPPDQPTISSMADPGSYLLSWQTHPQAAAYAVSFRPLDEPFLPALQIVPADGEHIFTDLNPNLTYGISLAPVSTSGRLGGFSAERIVP